MGWWERIGKASDRHPVMRRRPDGGMEVDRTRFAWATAAGIGVAIVLEALVGAAVGFYLALAFVIGCVIWRRRRNRRLTGSPTKWPDP